MNGVHFVIFFLFFSVFQTFYLKHHLCVECLLTFYFPEYVLVCVGLTCYNLSDFFFNLNYVFPVFSMEIKSQNSQRVYLKDYFPYSYCKYLIVSDLSNQILYFVSVPFHIFMGASEKFDPKWHSLIKWKRFS